MLYQLYAQQEIDYLYGSNENIKINQILYSDKKNVIKCPKCNNLIFYIENKFEHKCPIDNKYYKIELNNFKEFMCDINNIEFKCVKHQKDFLYFKDSNYYCNECLKENDFEDYLILDMITLSKKEIDDFKKLIKDSENILNEINIMNEKYIKKIKESNELFNKRNKTLIEYCKDLIKFNEKYDRNYNLISTIRRISKNINNINELSFNDLFNFYDNENIIKFNNEFGNNQLDDEKKIIF